MKSLLRYFILSLLYIPLIGFSQGTGDIMFTGWNADGSDGFSIVTFVDLAPNTTLYFRDSEWDGAKLGSDEGKAEWSSGSTLIKAGTVVFFDNTSAASFSATSGVLKSSDIALSSTADAVFCYIGPNIDSVGTILSAIGNSSEASSFGTLAGSGLTLGSTAVLLTNGTDVAEYIGTRNGLTKAGYILELNKIANYVLQDGAGDQDKDGTAPDVPFNLTPFALSVGDNLAPSALSAQILSSTSTRITFNEKVNATSATFANSALNSANYSITPSLAITSITYDSIMFSVTLMHGALVNGTPYTITVRDIADQSGNVQTTPREFSSLLWNTSKPSLVITEIMYNLPTGINEPEFFEIWNTGTTAVNIGGLVVRDVNATGTTGNFRFTLPSRSIAPNTGFLLAPSAAYCDSFYKVSGFIDLPGDGNYLGNGGEGIQLLNSLNESIDSIFYDDEAGWPLTPDGGGPSLELLRANSTRNIPASWRASTTLVGQLGGVNVFASPGKFTEVQLPTVGFASNHSAIRENAGIITIPITISNNSGSGSLTVSISATSPGTSAADYAIDTLTYQLAQVGATLPLRIRLVNNNVISNAKWVALRLTASGATVTSNNLHVLYILDDDVPVISPNKNIKLNYVNSYKVTATGTAEIVAHDPVSKRLFVVNSGENILHVLDFKNPKNITQVKQISMASYGGGITSVATYNGTVAVAVMGDSLPLNGKIVLLDAEGTFRAQYATGNLPDHVSFTPDGKYVLSANEGQPSGDYKVDPEGSITIVNLQNGITAGTIRQVDFKSLNSQLAALRDSGIRMFGPNATVAQDLEPEYIAYNTNSTKAYVTLQENNAIATIDIATGTLDKVTPLGFKDHSLVENALDASDRNSAIVMANWPILGMYQPDGITHFEANGVGYLITANEGDTRDYPAFLEEASFGSLKLDSVAFPNASILQQQHALGRLVVSKVDGDTDMDGDFDKVYVYGGRSITIWDANTMAKVWDGGSELERVTAADTIYGRIFNASNNNTTVKNRSDNKGPEPEAVITAQIKNRTYAFVGLERIGGIAVYDVSVPTSPTFVDYVNSRGTGSTATGDLGPEGLIYLSPKNSPTDTGLVVVANEVSATISVYAIGGDIVLSNKDISTVEALNVYPNPVISDVLYFDRPIDYELYNANGQLVRSGADAAFTNMGNLTAGIYYLHSTKDGIIKKVNKI